MSLVPDSSLLSAESREALHRWMLTWLLPQFASELIVAERSSESIITNRDLAKKLRQVAYILNKVEGS